MNSYPENNNGSEFTIPANSLHGAKKSWERPVIEELDVASETNSLTFGGPGDHASTFSGS